MILGSRPDLAHAYLTDLQIQGRTIRFWIEGTRRAGLIWAGILTLRGVTRVSTREPRLADDVYDFTPGYDLCQMIWYPRTLELVCSRPTGPGDADYPTYLITFDSTSCSVWPSLGRTLRYSVSFYPLQRDRWRRPLGRGSRGGSVAEVNAMLAAQGQRPAPPA